MMLRLLEEARELAEVARKWAEALEPRDDLTPSLRALLELFAHHGALTVPTAARARGISRQGVQHAVDQLLDRGLLERDANPAHRRSPLFSCSHLGRALLANRQAKERNALAQLRAGTSDHAVDGAIQTMRAWSEVLRGDIRARST